MKSFLNKAIAVSAIALIGVIDVMAQPAWPERAIKVIVPYTLGGGTDAVTRGNAVWRVPLLPDGSISKVGVFRSFFGTSGPDGMAVDSENRLVVAQASLGGAFVVNARGEVTQFVRSPVGQTVTNVAYVPGTQSLYSPTRKRGIY